MKYNRFKTPLGRQPRSIREFFYASARIYADKPLFLQKENGEYKKYSYRQYKGDVEALGTELIARGLGGKHIIVMGENCYSWVLTYMAVVCGVGVIIPLDKELASEELANVAEISEAAAIFYSESCKDKAEALPESIKKFAFDDIYKLIETGNKKIEYGNTRYISTTINPDKMAVLLFTSGTTGVSKGVMLSNRNICSMLYQATSLVDMNQSDTLLSVLPLHHAYECSCGFLAPIYVGATVAFCENLKYVVRNLREVRPTVLICVPILAEAIYNKIKSEVSKRGIEAESKLAVKLTNLLGNTSLAVSAKKKLFSEVHAAFGGRLRLIISGGAPIDPSVLGGLRGFGINAIQGYGLTECGPLVAINPVDHPKDGSAGVGLPLGTLDIYNIKEDGTGEIRYRGENVMLGYFKDPHLTLETIRGGWFYTGDLGYIDNDGYLFITGRKKNVIVNAGGKNIFPEELEVYLGRNEFVKESVIVGFINENKKDYDIVAVIHPDYDQFKEVYGENYDKSLIEQELKVAVEQVNLIVQSYKQISMFIVRETEFEKNGARKIKRKGVAPSVAGEYKKRIADR